MEATRPVLCRCELLSYFTGTAQDLRLTGVNFDYWFLCRFQPHTSNPRLTLSLCEHDEKITTILQPSRSLLDAHSVPCLRQPGSISVFFFFFSLGHSFDAFEMQLNDKSNANKSSALSHCICDWEQQRFRWQMLACLSLKDFFHPWCALANTRSLTVNACVSRFALQSRMWSPWHAAKRSMKWMAVDDAG